MALIQFSFESEALETKQQNLHNFCVTIDMIVVTERKLYMLKEIS